jgi:hypothetical protein
MRIPFPESVMNSVFLITTVLEHPREGLVAVSLRLLNLDVDKWTGTPDNTGTKPIKLVQRAMYERVTTSKYAALNQDIIK